MTRNPDRQLNPFSVEPYYDIVIGVLLVVLTVAGVRTDTIRQGNVLWVILALAVFILTGYRDGVRLLRQPAAYALHMLRLLMLFVGTGVLVAAIDCSAQADTSLATVQAVLQYHFSLYYNQGILLLMVLAAFVIGAVAGTIRRITLGGWQRPQLDETSVLGTVLSVIGIMGRHPMLFLAIYRLTHAFCKCMYASAYTAPARSILLVCLSWFLLCAALRMYQIAGIRMSAEDSRFLDRIGDLYWDHMPWVDILFYIGAAAAFVLMIAQSSMLYVIMDWNWYYWLCMIVEDVLFLVALLRFWDDKDTRLAGVQWFILFTGLMMWYLSGLTPLFILCLLMIGAEGVSAHKLLAVNLIVSVLMMTLLAWASVSGYIFYYTVNGLHGMGIAYKTDYATHWLYIMMTYRIWRRGRMSLPEYGVGACLVIYIYHLTGARTSLICGTLFLGLCFLSDYLPSAWTHGIVRRLLYKAGLAVYPICALFSYGTALILGPTIMDTWVERGDFWYSTRARIKYGYLAFQQLPIRLLSQNVEERGAGGLPNADKADYFFMDNSYVRILIIYGICFLLVVMGVHIYMLYRCGKEQNKTLWNGLITAAIHSISEHHLMDIFHNVMPVLIFAQWDMEDAGETIREDSIEEYIEW